MGVLKFSNSKKWYAPLPMFRRKKRGPLDKFPEELESRIGKISLSGRYHTLPRQMGDDFKVSDTILGSGKSGNVRMATRKDMPRHKFAVKELKLEKVAKSTVDQLKSEVAIFLQMDHPYIARLHDVFESKGSLSLVMECLEGGELFARVRSQKCLKEEDAARVTWQMLQAVNYIHSQGIVHRDLKLENWLYDKEGGNNVKLIDFGFSKMCGPNGQMHASLGTVAYVAPEVLLQNYTSQCDLWSLGVISFVLLAGHMPFPSSEDRPSRILQGKASVRRDRWKHVSPEGLHFVRSLLVVDPTQRLTAQAALAHPWIKQSHQGTQVDVEVIKALQQFRHTSRFRRCCMEVVAWSLSSEQCAEVCEQFIQLAGGCHGTLTIHELKKAMHGLGVSDDAEVQSVFNALVLCCDKEIHYSEFLAAMVTTKIDLNEELISSAFRHFDVEGCGYITANSLRKLLGDTVEGAQVESLLGEAERVEQDRLSFSEFSAFLTRTSSLTASYCTDKPVALHGSSETRQCPSVKQRPSASQRLKSLAKGVRKMVTF
mmetsp:Transcript_96553/g.191379  ORF Transcript_96553/g.191379 Transcript_96553/m.191379 type:complete len:541 (-) Transcript_96553:94-1716(-)